MRRIFGLAAMSVGLMAGAATAQTKWDLPTAYPVGNFHTVNMQKMADAVKAGSGGKLDIVIHPNGSLYKANEIKRAVQTGQVPAGEILMVNLGNENPIFEIDGVPFLATSYADAKKLYAAQKPYVEKALDAQGMKLLYAVPWPPQGIFSGKEVNSTKDLENVPWRAYSPATARIGELLKAQAVTVQAAELAQALSSGKVVAMMTSSATGVDSKVWEQIKFYYDTQAWVPKNMVIISKAAFDKLDKATQDLLLAEAKKAEEAGWAASEKVTTDTKATLAANGMKVQPPSAALKDGLTAIGKTMTEEWEKKAGADGAALLQTYRK
jgi:TRAP-type C4-dicarboxylate transport system substrate-binding protein